MHIGTVVHREPEWDDTERAWMLALLEHDAGVGPCGIHHDLTADPENAFTTYAETCTVCAGLDMEARVKAEHDQEMEKALKGKPREPRPSDGRRTFVRQLTPEEIQKRRARRTQPPAG